MSASHLSLDPDQLDRKQRYLLMVCAVIPRPICWISTVNPQGITNLAPFSFFGAVSSDPPTVMLSVGRRRDGSHKDTARNLLDTSEGVIHICQSSAGATMVATSEALPPGQSEIDHLGLDSVASDQVRPPRLRNAAIALEAKVVHHREQGNGPVDLFLLEGVRFHLRHDLLVDGLPDAEQMGALGRLGGSLYCDTSTPFNIERPD
ncbi:MAG: flavin reductase family protein [Planctomycetota bacterium]|nr:flavin reductase family protein [Planctomycetota bacterium]